MANLSRGGFRWVRNKYAPDATSPPFVTRPVASAYATVLYNGDPVKALSDGTIAVATPGDAIFGVFHDAQQYYDGTIVRSGGKLPVSTWGSNMSRQSLARIILARGQIFEADCDDGTTFTTLATFQDAVEENVEWATGTAVNDQSGAVLDISTNNTTNTLSVKIEGIPNPQTQDFASDRVKLWVSFNLIQSEGSGSTTGT